MAETPKISLVKEIGRWKTHLGVGRPTNLRATGHSPGPCTTCETGDCPVRLPRHQGPHRRMGVEDGKVQLPRQLRRGNLSSLRGFYTLSKSLRKEAKAYHFAGHFRVGDRLDQAVLVLWLERRQAELAQAAARVISTKAEAQLATAQEQLDVIRAGAESQGELALGDPLANPAFIQRMVSVAGELEGISCEVAEGDPPESEQERQMRKEASDELDKEFQQLYAAYESYWGDKAMDESNMNRFHAMVAVGRNVAKANGTAQRESAEAFRLRRGGGGGGSVGYRIAKRPKTARLAKPTLIRRELTEWEQMRHDLAALKLQGLLHVVVSLLHEFGERQSHKFAGRRGLFYYFCGSAASHDVASRVFCFGPDE
mgnify:CR=1 FL=1